jgi:diketogulonate reductase-like aldo/keto reductase
MKKGSSEGFMPENLTETNIPETWRATGSLHDSSKARAIGVGDLKSKKIGDLLGVARVVYLQLLTKWNVTLCGSSQSFMNFSSIQVL